MCSNVMFTIKSEKYFSGFTTNMFAPQFCQCSVYFIKETIVCITLGNGSAWTLTWLNMDLANYSVNTGFNYIY